MLASRLLPLVVLLSACGAGSSEPSGPASVAGPQGSAPATTAPTPAPPPAPVAIPLPPSGKHMGATPTTDGKGLELRVWAPNAMSVATMGDLGTHALASEGGGMWAATIAGDF